MKFLGNALIFMVCAALLAEGAAVAQRRNEPNAPDSFLRFQVESTDELVQVLRTDAALRRRFARHFGVSEAEVVDFVKRSLIPYRMPADRTVTVYGVDRTGRIYGKRTRLRRGTRVWATRSGVPILKWLCANPMTKTLPRVAVAPRQQRPVPTPRVVSLPFQDIELPVTAPELSLVAVAPVVPDVGGLGGGAVALLPAVPAAPVEVTAPFVATAPGIGAFPFAFLPLAFLGQGGVGQETFPVVPQVPEHIIPEPGTVALLATGLPGLALALHRRRRRGFAG